VSWSADGRSLLVLTPAGLVGEVDMGGEARLIDVATGSDRPVGNGKVIFAAFSPVEPDRYAYATEQAVFLGDRSTPDHDRRIATPPEDPGWWPTGTPWAGWSPDGTAIGTGTFSSRIGAVDAATGEFRVLFRDTDDVMNGGWTWWR
jgi:hypothetical protein